MNEENSEDNKKKGNSSNKQNIPENDKDQGVTFWNSELCNRLTEFLFPKNINGSDSSQNKNKELDTPQNKGNGNFRAAWLGSFLFFAFYGISVYSNFFANAFLFSPTVATFDILTPALFYTGIVVIFPSIISFLLSKVVVKNNTEGKPLRTFVLAVWVSFWLLILALIASNLTSVSESLLNTAVNK